MLEMYIEQTQLYATWQIKPECRYFVILENVWKDFFNYAYMHTY